MHTVNIGIYMCVYRDCYIYHDVLLPLLVHKMYSWLAWSLSTTFGGVSHFHLWTSSLHRGCASSWTLDVILLAMTSNRSSHVQMLDQDWNVSHSAYVPFISSWAFFTAKLLRLIPCFQLSLISQVSLFKSLFVLGC